MIGRTAAILVPIYVVAALTTGLLMLAACTTGCGTEPAQIAEAAFYTALWPVFWFRVAGSLSDLLVLLPAGILVACIIFLLGIRGARR